MYFLEQSCPVEVQPSETSSQRDIAGSVRPITGKSVLQSGHNVCFFAQYVDKPLDSFRRAGDYFDREAPMRGD